MLRIIFSIYLLFPLLAYAQVRELRNKDLPTIIEKEKVYISGSAYVQTEESEIKQRGREHKLKKKLERIEKILKQKYSKEQAIDSLVTELEKISVERDKLNKRLEATNKAIAEECKEKVWRLAEKSDKLKVELLEARQELKECNLKLMVTYSVIAGQFLIIAVLL